MSFPIKQNNPQTLKTLLPITSLELQTMLQQARGQLQLTYQEMIMTKRNLKRMKNMVESIKHSPTSSSNRTKPRVHSRHRQEKRVASRLKASTKWMIM